MRTTLDLPDPLFKEVKTRAVQQGVTLKGLLASFIEAGLRAPQTREKEPASRKNPHPLPVASERVPGEPLPAALSNAETAPRGPTPELDALLAEIATRHPGFSCRDNLSRDALYDRP